ncbi:MAG: GAF domain-containing protein [Gemmatimonadales bacterium]
MSAAQHTHRPGQAYARPPLPPEEPQRLEALQRYKILDTLPEQAFDDVTLLAAHICQAPIALISLVDRNRQWFKSRVGLDAAETPRDVAFCAHAITARETMVVPDALADVRFANNPLVTSDPQIRFYAGACLRVAEGHAIGTLCVMDRVPRELEPAQQEALEALSRQVMAQLELRRQLALGERLRALVPICSVCGKVRNDRVFWAQVEAYTRDVTTAEQASSVCPECAAGRPS